MKTKKRSALRRFLAVLIACALVGVLLAAVLFRNAPAKTYSYASVQFTFDGAADALAPNGKGFDMSLLTSDEVLEQALRTASLEGVYTAEQLRQNLVAVGQYPENMVKQVLSYESLLNFTGSRELTVSDYHPTLYTVRLYNDFDRSIAPAQLQSLLGSILEAFRADFVSAYALNLDLSEHPFDLDQYDYPQMMTIIRQSIAQLGRYAQEMYEKDSSFLLNGRGFNDIAVRYQSLIDNDIARINAGITMNALTRNTARLMTQYQFEIRDLNNQKDKKQEQLTRMDELIASYEKNEIIYVSTADSLTKIDGNSSETYDALVQERKEVADEITDLNSEISTYQLRLADLKKDSQTEEPAPAAETAEGGEIEPPPMSQEEIEAAAKAAEEAAARQKAALEANIQELLSRSDAITQDFTALLQAYTQREINEATVSFSDIRYETPEFLSGSFIKTVIKTAGPICALGFLVCVILQIADIKKEEKKKKAA